MKVVALVSGGKDSCFAMMKCIQYNHEIVALANLMPVDDEVDELDSYMYQTVGHQIIVGYAECMGIPLFRRRIRGTTRHQNLSYKMTPGDEVEDMFILLSEVKRQIPSVTAVSSGAIASDYQRLRVESVCSRLGLVSLAYLWKQDQSLLLQEMITNGIVAILVKVAAIGLDPAKHLGKDLVALSPHLHKLKELYGINVCGEGGEYETLTLDCPLFINAHLVLDDFRIILHSADAIAPVGVIHPVAFHLVNKAESVSSSNGMGNSPGENSCVHEVSGDGSEECNVLQQAAAISDLPALKQDRPQLSLTKQDNVFCIRCWLKGSSSTSTDLQEDLEGVLQKVESELAKCGLSWENVLYIHLYISDMNEFVMANEVYVRYITLEKCRFGVPSRSTVELPLSQAGLGRAYIEILVANDLEKRVLHVQSISCWAPSCIGPYSQATLHDQVLYMAGQLGLDPPTMTLCSGGASAELELALENCEAVAKCFNCSISTSAILFVIYCSKHIPSTEMIKLQEKQDYLFKKMQLNNVSDGSKSQFLDPVVLYILVPDLPKRALVEVKPLLYVMDNKEMAADKTHKSHTVIESDWGFQQEVWHNSCIQKCVVVQGNLCMVLLSITNEIAAKICSESLIGDQNNQTFQDSSTLLQMQKVARFCVYLLDKALTENDFSWDRTTTLRFYFPITLGIPFEALSHAFSIAFEELAKMGKRISLSEEPIFNLVPVLAAGKSTKTMEDLITCELFTRSS